MCDPALVDAVLALVEAVRDGSALILVGLGIVAVATW